MMAWSAVAIGDICEPTEQRDPRRDPAGEFHYVDIAGIDRIHKTGLAWNGTIVMMFNGSSISRAHDTNYVTDSQSREERGVVRFAVTEVEVSLIESE